MIRCSRIAGGERGGRPIDNIYRPRVIVVDLRRASPCSRGRVVKGGERDERAEARGAGMGSDPLRQHVVITLAVNVDSQGSETNRKILGSKYPGA